MLHLIAKGRLTPWNGHEPSLTDDNTAPGGPLVDSGAELNRESSMRAGALTLAPWLKHPQIVRIVPARGVTLDHIRDSASPDSFFGLRYDEQENEPMKRRSKGSAA
jgi:hypothetical protein